MNKLSVSKLLIAVLSGLTISFVTWQFFGGRAISLIDKFTSRSATIKDTLPNPLTPSQLSYTLTIPDDWQGKYQIKKTANIASYVFSLNPEKQFPLFQIVSMSASQYQQENQDPNYQGKLIVSSVDSVLVLFKPPANPYIGTSHESVYQSMSDQVDQIMSTLTVE